MVHSPPDMKNLLWRLVNAVQFTCFFVWTVFWITFAVVLSTVTRRRSLALVLARRVWAPVLNRAALLRLEAEGQEQLEEGRAYYFASNHQSFLDIPVLFATLPTGLHFVAKAELASFPFIGWFVSFVGMVFVERGHRGKGLQAVERVTDLLREGKSVISFSEGTRGNGQQVNRFKSGGFRAPIAAGVPVVPVAIVGTSQAMPARSLALRPARVKVRIGAPIEVDASTERHRLAEATQQKVATMFAAARSSRAASTPESRPGPPSRP